MSYADQFLGQTMKNGENGCVEAVGLMGAGNSPFLANEYNKGQFSVEGLVSDARNSGIPIIPYSKGAANPNDVYIYGNNDHATLADGSGGYWGNSSSHNKIVKGNDAEAMGGLQPTAIIKTGGNQNGSFNFQANDAQGNPFMNLKAYLRVSNPSEQFDQQSIMGILGQSTPSYETSRLKDFLTHEDYSLDALSHGADVYQYLKPHADKLMALRDADLKSQIDIATKQQRLGQAIQLANLINQSSSVDNRRAYSALGKMFGIGVPDDSDQFVSSSDLLSKQIALNNAERNYNFEKQKEEKSNEFKQKELDLKKEMADRQYELSKAKLQAAMAARGGGSSGGGYSKGNSKGPTFSNAKAIVEMHDNWAKEHPGEDNPVTAYAYGQAVQALNSTFGQSYDPDDYGADMSDATSLLAKNMRAIESGDPTAKSKEALQALMRNSYGDNYDDVNNSIDWSYWDL